MDTDIEIEDNAASGGVGEPPRTPSSGGALFRCYLRRCSRDGVVRGHCIGCGARFQGERMPAETVWFGLHRRPKVESRLAVCAECCARPDIAEAVRDGLAALIETL
jgi:hypothetical protein